MNIVIIGSGNVATVMIKLMQLNQINVLQVFSRNSSSVQELGNKYKIETTSSIDAINKSADIYLLCISDAALTENLSYLNIINDKPIFHTAASVSKEVLKNVSSNYGVIYPLQTLRKEMEALPEIPLLIDANNESTMQIAKSLSEKISTTVLFANDESRLKLHVAAVMVNNFTNHLFALAEDYCNKEQIDFKVLHPLIAETAKRAIQQSPAQMQTGPAVRNDIVTLEKHLQLLHRYPELKTLYLSLSDSIMNHQR